MEHLLYISHCAKPFCGLSYLICAQPCEIGAIIESILQMRSSHCVKGCAAAETYSQCPLVHLAVPQMSVSGQSSESLSPKGRPASQREGEMI